MPLSEKGVNGYGEIQKMRMTSWRTSRCSYASKAIANSYLAELGLYDLASIKTGVLPEVP